MSPPASAPATVAAVAPATGVDVRSFGVVGDGVTDDTAALARAVAAVPAGGTLLVPAGLTVTHSKVVDLRTPGMTLTGGGTLLATAEETSSVWIDADDVTVADLTLRTATTTQRWGAWEQMGLRLAGHSGAVVRDVRVFGAASAGIYVGHATDYLLDHVTVRDSRSDGIHNSESSRRGTIRDAVVSGSGDDGIAVVSYEQDGAPCSDITISDSSVSNNVWGRGISVVGGTRITYTGISISDSDSAAVYLATEGGQFNTSSTTDVTVSHVTITRANKNAAIDHGAILVYAGRSGFSETGLHLSDITITDTRDTASRQVAAISDGGVVSDVTMDGFTIAGGSHWVWWTNTTGVTRSAWTRDGAALPTA